MADWMEQAILAGLKRSAAISPLGEGVLATVARFCREEIEKVESRRHFDAKLEEDRRRQEQG